MSTSDTSERGLERLICTALAGHPCDPPAECTVAEPSSGYGGVRVERRQLPRLRPRVLRRSGAARGLPADDPAGGRRSAGAVRGRSHAARISYPAAGRDQHARHHRGATQRDQARSTAPGSVLRHALRAQPDRRRSGSSRTGLPSPGSFAIAGTRHSGRWTSGCSSTGCRCSPSS